MVNAIISLVWFVLTTVTVVIALSGKGKHEKVGFIIALFLLIYKSGEYLYYIIIGAKNPFPVELSAVTYFLFPIVVLFKLKKLEDLAAFCALISGFFFMATFVITGGKNFDYSGSLFRKIMAVVNHSMLYAGGLLKMKANLFDKQGRYKVIFGLGVILFYSWIMKELLDYGNSFVFIHQLMTADLVFGVFPALKEFNWFLPLYFTVLISGVMLGIQIFYSLNKKLHAVYLRQTHSVTAEDAENAFDGRHLI